MYSYLCLFNCLSINLSIYLSIYLSTYLSLAADKVANGEEIAGEDDVDMLESLDPDVDPEEDLNHFIAVLVESLSRLGKLPEAIEQIKAKMQSQLMAVISRWGKWGDDL